MYKYDKIIEDRELVTVTLERLPEESLSLYHLGKTYSTLVFYHQQFVKCAENIITNYKTANAVTSANLGLM